MYNEKIKIDFMTSLRRNNIGYDRLTYKTIFEQAEIFEQAHQKDAAYFNLEENKELLMSMQVNDAIKYRPALTEYQKWFKKKKDPDLIISKMPTTLELRRNNWMSKDFVLLSEDFIEKIAMEQITVNPMLAFMFIALYNGLKGDFYSEIFYAELHEINIVKKTINVYHYDKSIEYMEYSRTIPVSNLFIKIANIVDATKSPDGTNKKSAYYYEDTDFIYKFGIETGDRSDMKTLRYMTATVKRKFRLYRQRYNVEITAEQIRLSGMINSIIEAMEFYHVDFFDKRYIEIINEVAERYNASLPDIEKVRLYLEEK